MREKRKPQTESGYLEIRALVDAARERFRAQLDA
jgi:hypothetical protein